MAPQNCRCYYHCRLSLAPTIHKEAFFSLHSAVTRRKKGKKRVSNALWYPLKTQSLDLNTFPFAPKRWRTSLDLGENPLGWLHCLSRPLYDDGDQCGCAWNFHRTCTGEVVDFSWWPFKAEQQMTTTKPARVDGGRIRRCPSLRAPVRITLCVPLHLKVHLKGRCNDFRSLAESLRELLYMETLFSFCFQYFFI